MKAIYKSLLLIIAVIAFHGCDKVSAPYKETIDITPPPPNGTRKKVLVEDFTGHRCGNCPRASKAMYDLKPVYGDDLIVMAIHAGGFAEPYPAGFPYFTYDFRTPEGDQLDTDFGISLAGNPNGMINRKQVDGSYIIGSTKWGSEVGNVLNDTTPAAVKLTITNDYNSTSRELQTTIESQYFNTLSGTHKLCVFMVEDSIINWQKDYDVTTVPQNNIEFYVHRESLRGSMNGTYGEAVPVTTQGTTSTLNYTYTLPLEWNENQVSIITYLYNEATKEILQVEQAHIQE